MVLHSVSAATGTHMQKLKIGIISTAGIS